jgi:hypothetical protein
MRLCAGHARGGQHASFAIFPGRLATVRPLNASNGVDRWPTSSTSLFLHFGLCDLHHSGEFFSVGASSRDLGLAESSGGGAYENTLSAVVNRLGIAPIRRPIHSLIDSGNRNDGLEASDLSRTWWRDLNQMACGEPWGGSVA